MGLSAGLFYSATADEKTLYTRIRPTDDQFDRQQTYWNELAEFLKEDLAQPNIPIRSWLQGSYKFGTQYGHLTKMASLILILEFILK